MRNSTKTISMKLLRRSGLQTKNRIKSYEKIYSLMVHALAHLNKKGIRAGFADLQSLGSQTDPTRWFSDVLYQIERSLKLRTDSGEWWAAHDRLGPTQRFMSFLEDVVLTEIKGNVVLFLDEIDSVLSLPFSDDFFTTIR